MLSLSHCLCLELLGIKALALLGRLAELRPKLFNGFREAGGACGKQASVYDSFHGLLLTSSDLMRTLIQ